MIRPLQRNRLRRWVLWKDKSCLMKILNYIIHCLIKGDFYYGKHCL
nr:MAG TPA: hypothetical protein [Caudoviricetes sp.]